MKLTLSTAVPRADATPPTIETLRVYADPREPPKKVLVSREEQVEHAQAAKWPRRIEAAGFGFHDFLRRLSMNERFGSDGLALRMLGPIGLRTHAGGTAALRKDRRLKLVGAPARQLPFLW